MYFTYPDMGKYLEDWNSIYYSNKEGILFTLHDNRKKSNEASYLKVEFKESSKKTNSFRHASQL